MTKSVLLSIIFSCFVATAQAACPAGSTCAIYNGTVPYDATYGTTTRTPAARAVDQGINVLEFSGIDPTGSTDSSAAIQAAVDAAWAASNGQRRVVCPDGLYKVSLPIYVDPPGNIRGANGTAGPTYSSLSTYALNATVNYSGTAYVSLQAGNLNNTPSSSPTFWRPFAYASGTTYASGAIVSSSGIPWVSQVGGNVGNAPTLPPKWQPGYIAIYALGAVVEFDGVYWVSQSSGNAGNYPFTGSAFWTATTVYWLPTALAPTIFNQSYDFGGTGGMPGSEGCQLNATFNNTHAVYVGPGRGNYMQSFVVTGPALGGVAEGYRCGQPQAYGVAFTYNGSRSLVDKVGVQNFWGGVGFNVLAQPDDLVDSNTIWKSNIGNACVAVAWGSGASNALINSIYESNLGGTISIFNPVGQDVRVYGGNLSATSAMAFQFSVSGVSSLTAQGSGGSPAYGYTFTATLGGPAYAGGTTYNQYDLVSSGGTLWYSASGGNVGHAPSLGAGYWWPVEDYISNNVVTAFAVNTTQFGVVPMLLTSFTPSTHSATFLLWPKWVANAFPTVSSPFVNLASQTGLQTQLQAATTIYGAERVVTVFGSGTKIDNVHVENYNVSTLIEAYSDYGTAGGSSISNTRYNFDPALSVFNPNNSPTESQASSYFVQQSFPFINLSNGAVLEIRNSFFETGLGATNDNFIVDMDNSATLKVAGSATFTSPNIRCVGGGNDALWPAMWTTANVGGGGYYFSTAFTRGGNGLGCGEYDFDPFVPHSTYNPASIYRATAGGSGAFWGWYPAYNTTPRLTPSQVSAILPAAFTASVATNILTVTAVSSGVIGVGQSVFGAGLASSPTISGLGSGTGGAGTYYLSVSQSTIGSETMTSGVPAFTDASALAYPLIAGNTIYSVADALGAPVTNPFVKASFRGYSYGQNLTTSNVTSPALAWSYQGQSNVVAVNNINRLFQGLGVYLDPGNGDGPQWYNVTGIWPNLGYITVIGQTTSNNLLDGLDTLTYSGTLISQDSYATVTPF